MEDEEQVRGEKIVDNGKHPVENAIKVLMACIYKSVNTGLFLKSPVAASIFKFVFLLLESLSALYVKANTITSVKNLSTLAGTSDFKNCPVFTHL